MMPNLTPPPEPYVRPLRADVDVIGLLYEPPVRPDGWTLGDHMPDPVLIPGWHVNARQRVIEAFPELAAYVVTPAQPRQVWEDGAPVCLRFADAEEAAGVAPDLQLHLTEAARLALIPSPVLELTL